MDPKFFEKYEATMGLEIHARLKSQTKMFCACSNNTWQAQPNDHTCPVCMGFPGALPVANREAVRLGRVMGAALGCEIKKFSKFDRKSYFYPDLPSGFQISQMDEPVCEHGELQVVVEGEERTFGINRLHLENDAGKLTHSANSSLVDWNRSGSPLAEMVTEPCFHYPVEVSTFLKELQRILRMLNISDADMEKGMMRCDVNVSIRPIGQKELGTKVEMKNMNSFRNIEKALEYEMNRQWKMWETGKQEQIRQETRGFDVDKNKTYAQRGKEEAMDYRYFPEPDLPPLTITQDEIDEIKQSIPELPASKILRFIKSGVPYKEADALVGDVDIMHFFEAVAEKTGDIKKSANWTLGAVSKYRNEHPDFSISDFDINHLASLITMIDEGKISGKIANDIFPDVIANNLNPLKIVEERGLAQVSDAGELKKICATVLEEKSDLVEQYKAGKDKLFGAFVGQVMKATKGQANPQIVNEILKKLLG